MPLGPAPRMSASSTVSAWSSRVCPSRTAWAPCRSAARSSAAYRASLAAASGPPEPSTRTATASEGSSPMSRPHSAMWAARSAEPSWRPWSTLTSPARRPARGAQKASVSARAMESGPPEQATSTRDPRGRSLRLSRTAMRRRAIEAGSLAMPDGRGRAVQDPGDPRLGVLDLGLGGQVQRTVPDPAEAGDAVLGDYSVDEAPARRVLPHLGVQSQQLAQEPLERSGVGPAAVEPAAQERHVLDVVPSDAVHDRFGVAFEEGHERLDPRDGLALRGAGHGLHDVGARLAFAGLAGGLVAGGVEGPAHGAAELGGRGLGGFGGVEERADEVLEVAAHPRHRGELHEVGGFVDGDPQPELAGGESQASFDFDDVGGHEQEPPGVGGEGLELA